jgi:putative hemolysin
VHSHGAPRYPDPNSDGVFIMTPQNAADFHDAPASAMQACSLLHPRWDESPELSPAMQAQVNRANLALARCMHRHGIRKFPDNSGGGINIGRMQSLGIDTNSPQFSAALKACGF